jgi:hypothetical protein
MLFDFAIKITQLLVTNPPSAGGSVYAGMSVPIILDLCGSLSSGTGGSVCSGISGSVYSGMSGSVWTGLFRQKCIFRYSIVIN